MAAGQYFGHVPAGTVGHHHASAAGSVVPRRVAAHLVANRMRRRADRAAGYLWRRDARAVRNHTVAPPPTPVTTVPRPHAGRGSAIALSAPTRRVDVVASGPPVAGRIADRHPIPTKGNHSKWRSHPQGAFFAASSTTATTVGAPFPSPSLLRRRAGLAHFYVYADDAAPGVSFRGTDVPVSGKPKQAL